MKLVEFGLDLIYIANEDKIALIMDENSIERQETTRQDYAQNWKWKRRDFSNQTRCITALFSRLFGYIKTDDCWKILVECVDEVCDSSIINISGVCTVQVESDYEAFMTLDEFGKKKTALELLMTGIRLVAAKQNWDMMPFERTYEGILGLKYVNEWIWNKPIKNSKKNAVACIFIQHNVYQVFISIIINDKAGNELIRKRIITETPNEWSYAAHLGEIKWIDDNTAALINKKKDKSWALSL